MSAVVAVLIGGVAVGCTAVLGIDKDYQQDSPGGAGGMASSTTTGGSGGTAGSGGTGGGPEQTNVVLEANGATVESFSSEYCVPQNPPNDCEAGYFDHTNINDGEHAHGADADAARATWASADKGGQDTPEEFVFSFASGMSARISRVVLQNYGEEAGPDEYYSTHAILYAEAPGGGGWSEILDVDLATNDQPQQFDLVALHGSEVEASRLRLAITAGVHDRYWDLGEFEAWGYLF